MKCCGNIPGSVAPFKTKRVLQMNKILNEQNDVNQIRIDDSAIEAAMRNNDGNASIDVGGRQVPVWDAMEYGVSRDEVLRQLDAARTPEAKEAIIADVRQRAILRADLDTTNGRVALAVAGEAAWHGLGVQVAEAMTSTEAIKLGGLDVSHFRVPAYYPVNGKMYPIPNVYGIGRQLDDGSVKVYEGTTVSKKYSIFQNHECFAFMDRLLGNAKFDSVGATAEGQKIFLSVKFEDVFEAVPGDEVHRYGLLTNAHGLAESLCFFGTDVRTVCNNTRAQALRGRQGGFNIAHTTNMRAQIASAESAIAASAKAFKNFETLAEAMVKASVLPQVFASAVVDGIAEADYHYRQMFLSAEEMRAGLDGFIRGAKTEAERTNLERRYNRKLANRTNFLDQLLELDASKTNTVPGSVWGIFNATTEHANHGLRYQGSARRRQETRLSSILTGRAATINEVALRVAEQFIAS